jgi:hypothetical protein
MWDYLFPEHTCCFDYYVYCEPITQSLYSVVSEDNRGFGVSRIT